MKWRRGFENSHKEAEKMTVADLVDQRSRSGDSEAGAEAGSEGGVGRLSEIMTAIDSPTDARSIRQALDAVVVGQADAKNAISVLLSAHLSVDDRVGNVGSPNALLIGPTGVGKTHTVHTAADFLGLPYVNVDSTALVPSSAQDGMTIEKVLVELLISAETILAERNMFAEISAVELASRGLIFLDEFDKLRVDRESDWNLRLQRRLLRLMEGSFTAIPEARGETIDTSKISFLASGTFEGVRDPIVVSQRPAHLNSTLREQEKVVSVDLVNYGFLPELIARLPVLVAFDSLSSRDLVGVLDNPRVDPTQLWSSYFRSIGKDLLIETEAKILIAEQAEKLNMGARGLQQVIFPMLARLSLDHEDGDQATVIVTRELCKAQLRKGW
ncbi:AAA family ATPase [Pseudonocardia nematodicida]|uniref:AAA family ATPase n=1 Tax=Pseudonocardia nematodicida TaxID=1206997 RepID=A0ABV1KHG2_9PSEU